jgi:hypothetical protein
MSAQGNPTGIAWISVPLCFCLFSVSPRAAFALDDLKYELAVLGESVEAGVSQDEFHRLRIEIGARLRIASDEQKNALADFLEHLRAADAIWTGIKSEYPCHNNSAGFLEDAATCVQRLGGYYHSLGIEVPQVERVSFQETLIRPVLTQIAKETDLALTKLK